MEKGDKCIFYRHPEPSQLGAEAGTYVRELPHGVLVMGEGDLAGVPEVFLVPPDRVWSFTEELWGAWDLWRDARNQLLKQHRVLLRGETVPRKEEDVVLPTA